MKRYNCLVTLFLIVSLNALARNDESSHNSLKLLDVSEVMVNDPFWSPRLTQWKTITSHDVLNKFEGDYAPFPGTTTTRNAFHNFDRVAEGKRDIGLHDGPEWYDGLVYETIRGISDLLAIGADLTLEKRIDGFIDRIYAAQQTDPDGYINTHTQLMESNHRWGDDGGFLRGQHDVYNAGMLIEAGIHYYNATGKTRLLEMGTRFANYMVELMGPSPKRNIVPAHSGPEEALIKLAWLYRADTSLKEQLRVPVSAESYLALAKFWIENRGVHCGYPLWETWGFQKSDRWIRDAQYQNPEFGSYSRPCWGEYAQDSVCVFEQTTMEGHAVRATLLATGITCMALEQQTKDYIDLSRTLWDNMVGKRFFINGGVGAIHYDEKFGPDYYLPTDAYLETCAAVGAGFFSQRMNELTKEAKYIDELERSLYNNILCGISLTGDKYTYQNPLNADKFKRWEWHECPCCPPMFLKMVSLIPSFIYAHDQQDIYVNLFIGSEATIPLPSATVTIKQETSYPWKGDIKVTVDPQSGGDFGLKLRIPGWSQGIENPYGLYTSNSSGSIEVLLNGKPVDFQIDKGYVTLCKDWQKGDVIDLKLPVIPRIIESNDQVKELDGCVAFAAGPLVYSLEACDNVQLNELVIDQSSSLRVDYQPDLLDGINVIKTTATGKNNEAVDVFAVPYFTVGNRSEETGFRTWIKKK